MMRDIVQPVNSRFFSKKFSRIFQNWSLRGYGILCILMCMQIPDLSASTHSAAVRLRYLALRFLLEGVAVFAWIFLVGLMMAALVHLGLSDALTVITVGKLMAVLGAFLIIKKLHLERVPLLALASIAGLKGAAVFRSLSVPRLPSLVSLAYKPPRLVSLQN